MKLKKSKCASAYKKINSSKLTRSQKDELMLAVYFLIERNSGLNSYLLDQHSNLRIWSEEVAKWFGLRRSKAVMDKLIEFGFISLVQNKSEGRSRGYSLSSELIEDLTRSDESIKLNFSQSIKNKIKKDQQIQKDLNKSLMNLIGKSLSNEQKRVIKELSFNPSKKQIAKWKAQAIANAKGNQRKISAIDFMEKNILDLVKFGPTQKLNVDFIGSNRNRKPLRFYHDFTSVPSALTSMIQIDGERTIDFDLSQCHLAFSLIETGQTEMFKKYKEGFDFYKEIGEQIGISREESKKKLCAVLSEFRTTARGYSFEKAISKMYPEFYQGILELRKKHGKELYIVWQLKEWEVVKERIYPILMKNNIKFLDWHDGFKIKESDKELVEQLVSKELNGPLDPNFKFKKAPECPQIDCKAGMAQYTSDQSKQIVGPSQFDWIPVLFERDYASFQFLTPKEKIEYIRNKLEI